MEQWREGSYTAKSNFICTKEKGRRVTEGKVFLLLCDNIVKIYCLLLYMSTDGLFQLYLRLSGYVFLLFRLKY